jgi:predicted MFS family arabinose efflux permease
MACVVLRVRVVGVIWSVVWYWWFRDSPAEKRGVSLSELEETRQLTRPVHRALPWNLALRSPNLWAVMGIAFCYVYTFYFFQSWFHTYLVRARGFDESALWLSSLPFLVGACANCAGGFVSHGLVRKYGLEWGRRSIGLIGMVTASICLIGVTLTHQPFTALVLLSIAYGGITFQQPTVFAVCLDIAGEYPGAVVGAMNSAAQVGAFISSVMFGLIVDRTGSYDTPLIPMIALLLAGGSLWFLVDPNRVLIPEPRLERVGLSVS